MARSVQIRSSLAIIFGLFILAAGAALGFAAVTVLAGHSALGHRFPVYIKEADSPARDPGASGAMGFAPVFQPALPAVVSIGSSRIVKVPQSPFFGNPFFQQFFGEQPSQGPQEERERGLGSGVIVNSNGYILTNNHVIEKATDIKVILADKRQFPGKVVGADPQTDLAVVKIDTTGLPTVTLGDSSKLRVGDYAFAVGNPFGVGETATMGIISATGRNGLDIEDYEDFIQTDAAINPGNSGGALLNARGELIGINTAILAGGSGGSQGIGFAIPINMAKYVMGQIIQQGKVVRGYIGVGIQEVTPTLAQAFKVPAEKGALVSNVYPSSPAAKSGLQRGDVITQMNGQPLAGPNDLRLKVGTMAPGSTVHFEVDRAGHSRQVDVTLAEAPRRNQAGPQQAGPEQNNPMKGVQVHPLTNDIRQQIGVGPDVKGVVVTDLAGGSPAREAGLKPGDVIEQIDRQPVTSVADYYRLIGKAGKQAAVLLINREGSTTYVVVQPE